MFYRHNFRIVFSSETRSSFKFCHSLCSISTLTPQPHKSYLTNAENNDKIKLIKQNTKISRKHLTPEIGLHLITKECDAWFWKHDEIQLKDPFWAFYWPGGQALSRYLLDNSHEIENSTVLDVGCGSGASSIAAVCSKAKEVIANDIDIDCCIATALNAELNHINLKVSREDYLGNSNIPWDCILIGDMFYNDDFSFKISKWLEDLHSQGRKIFIGDPGRFDERNCKTHLRKNLKLLKTYTFSVDMIVEDDRFSTASVLTFD